MLPARRLALIPALLSVCALMLTACGDDDGGDDFPGAGKSLDRLDAVTISGDVGSPPEVKWKAAMDAGKVETETITEGDGDALKGQDDVLAHLWIGNGFSKEQAFSTYDEKRAELLTVNNQLPEFLAGIRDAKVGSRLAITASAEEAFGPAGNSQLGIGNKDTVLVIVDLVSKVLDKPEGERTPYPEWMPIPQFKQRRADRLQLRRSARADRRPAPRAADQGHRPPGREGPDHRGPLPRPGLRRREAVRRELQRRGRADHLRDRHRPGHQGLGPGPRSGCRSVPGWCSQIPPELGYGEAGNEQAGITGTDTLVFMIDILAAA